MQKTTNNVSSPTGSLSGRYKVIANGLKSPLPFQVSFGPETSEEGIFPKDPSAYVFSGSVESMDSFGYSQVVFDHANKRTDMRLEISDLRFAIFLDLRSHIEYQKSHIKQFNH